MFKYINGFSLILFRICKVWKLFNLLLKIHPLRRKLECHFRAHSNAELLLKTCEPVGWIICPIDLFAWDFLWFNFFFLSYLFDLCYLLLFWQFISCVYNFTVCCLPLILFLGFDHFCFSCLSFLNFLLDHINVLRIHGGCKKHWIHIKVRR